MEAASAGSADYRKECAHYIRGCSLVSPCCGIVYPCRLCHDDKELSHGIDRHAVVEVVCRKCLTRQKVSSKCVKCKEVFGRYFCPVCRLYDDKESGQFHCDKCGLCRIGGKDNYFHCDNCGLCLHNNMRDNHGCRRQMSRNNCPVCMEDIHTSRIPAHVPNCGHLLHMQCYRELMTNGLYQCPQCQTSLADMSAHWQALDTEREAWQLPQHLREFQVKVNCRDCHKESRTMFHVVGLKCSHCGGYNTVRCGEEEVPVDEWVRARAQRRADRDTTDTESENTSSGSEHSEPEDDEPEDPGNQVLPRQQAQPHHPSGGNHGNGANGNGRAPCNKARDDDEVDDGSYDGDESDSSDDCSSDDDLFHCTSRGLTFEPRRSRARCSNNRPIRSQNSNWWGDDDEATQCRQNHTPLPRKPHPPVQLVVEQFKVMEIWGSDYFTDSFSEVSSSSEASSCEDSGYPQRRSKKPSTKHDRVTEPNGHSIVTAAMSRDSTQTQSLTRLYSEAPSLTYPIETGLNRESTFACSYPPATGRLSVCFGEIRKEFNNLRGPGGGWGQTTPLQVKSSSEESWFTANEDLELGTLV